MVRCPFRSVGCFSSGAACSPESPHLGCLYWQAFLSWAGVPPSLSSRASPSDVAYDLKPAFPMRSIFSSSAPKRELSLDYAIQQVGNVLHSSSPEVAKEFAATAAEMRVLPVRVKALENLAERTGLASLRSIVITLNQSIQFGTSLAESLRTLAAERRAERLAHFEERAARLPVLLTLPLMAFVLPSLIVVIATPLVLRILGMFGTTQ